MLDVHSIHIHAVHSTYVFLLNQCETYLHTMFKCACWSVFVFDPADAKLPSPILQGPLANQEEDPLSFSLAHCERIVIRPCSL